MTQAPDPKTNTSNQTENKEEKPAWNFSLANILIQALAGGGIGTLVTLLSSSELPKLALGGAIGGGVAPIVLSIAEPFQKRLKQGASYVSEAAASGAEKNAQKWLTGLSGFERSYLKALQNHCYALEVEGFRSNLPPLALNDVYIPLRLTTDRGNIYGQARIDTTIWNFLPKTGQEQPSSENRLAVIANPGYGKTTLTRYLALSFSCPTYESEGAAKRLPVLLRYRDIYKLIQSEAQPRLEALIVQSIKALPTCGELSITEAWIEQQLKDGRCLVMLDGLDEVPEDRRETVSRWTNRQMQTYPSFFVLTSRPHGYDASLFQAVRQLEILNFTNDEKRSFLAKWYCMVLWRQKWEILWKESQQKPEFEQLSEAQAKAQSDAEAAQAAADLYRQIVGNLAINQQLAVNPLLLTIIAATHNAFDALPERRVNLYRKMFNLLLEDRPNRRDTCLKLREAAQNQDVLQALAWNLTKEQETQFTRKQGASWIKKRLAEHCSPEVCKPEQFFQDIEQVAGLLTGGDSDLYQFAHKTFQEYLVACEIRERNLQSLLLKRLQSPDWQRVKDWQEIYSFYAALAGADELAKTVVAMPEGANRQQALLMLHQIVKEEKSQIRDHGLGQQFEDLFSTVATVGKESKFVKPIEFTKEEVITVVHHRSLERKIIFLESRFRNMVRLNSQTEITTSPITWGEYQLFLEAQNTGQFHSMAQPQTILPEQLDQPVTGLSKADRNWFCAWLSTQTSLQAEDLLFTYELPTPQHYQAAKIAADEQFYIIRRTINPKYAQLMNYLASASWIEADEETYRLMITAVGKEEGQRFKNDDFWNFPCEDLRTIEGLWVKYSQGRFGFSVQKQIYVECGAKLDGEYPGKEIWERFGDRVGWRKDDRWLTTLLNPSLSSPQGIFPWRLFEWSRGYAYLPVHYEAHLSFLAQRLVNCNIKQS